MEDHKQVANEPGIADRSTAPDRSGQSKTLLTLWKDFGNDTTMHALGRAVNSLQLWKKVIWSILVMAAALLAARNVYLTIEDYASFPVSTTVSLLTKRKLDFPGITLCNLNPYRVNHINESIKHAVYQSLQNGDSVKKQEKIFKRHFNKVYSTLGRPDDVFHPLSEMLVDCQFDLTQCSKEEFLTMRNLKYGNCYTINVVQPYWVSHRPGNRNGFIIEMNIQQSEYLPFTPSAGLKVVIHDPKVMPFPEEDGIVVRSGVSTSIGLRKETVKRQIPPWGSCMRAEDADSQHQNMFQSKNVGYSQTACQKTCYQRSVLDTCGCCDKNYPCWYLAQKKVAELGGSVFIMECNQTNKEEYGCVKEIREHYLQGLLQCMDECRPACEEIMFKTSYATSSWPSLKYLDNLSIKVANASARHTGKMVHPSNISTDYLQNNFVRLEIYYEKFNEELIVASPAYNWNSLLSDLGGQLGLWMGFSLMTAIEFLELGWDLLVHLCCKIRSSRKRQ